VAVPFFALKYLVDKYNLSFVYNTEFMGVGRIKQKITSLAAFNVLLAQTMITALIIHMMDSSIQQLYVVVGVSTLVLELVLLIAYTMFNRAKEFEKRKKNSKIEPLLKKKEKKLEEVPEPPISPYLGKSFHGNFVFEEQKIAEKELLCPYLLEENLTKLKQAYRHPFEFISPKLYIEEGSEADFIAQI
jgi:hypothetical protein